ncbi:serine/threonine protein kinase [Bacillus sp. A301a_S52]|nr:serine/threonine protein kinase [Bacillus sp. A301a_S52]
MMKQPSSKSLDNNFYPGQTITGRWHGKKYVILKVLGEGAIGKVYLARHGRQLMALKVAHNAMSVSSEVHVLRQISKVQGLSLGPSFLDMDDVATAQGNITFYAMEYIHGEPFLPFVRNKGIEWLGIFVVQLLGDLQKMHDKGWVFGDIKPENLLITSNPYQLRWIDPGGVTKRGRSIKEYTEFFDRGYWGAGDRKADPAYDLFSVSMLIVNRSYPARFYKEGVKGTRVIIEKTSKQASLIPYAPIIEKGVTQRYEHALEMKKDVMEVLRAQQANVPPSRKKKRISSFMKQKHASAITSSTSRTAKKRSGFKETAIFASFLLILYILYLTG